MTTKREYLVSKGITVGKRGRFSGAWFNPSICASVIVNRFPLYTQDRLMELMTEIIKEQASRFEAYWEEGFTSEAIMLASHLAEVIEAHEVGIQA